MKQVLYVYAALFATFLLQGAALSDDPVGPSRKRTERRWADLARLAKSQRANNENCCTVDNCKSVIAKEFFFDLPEYSRQKENLPDLLRNDFKGVSIQDYLNKGVQFDIETNPSNFSTYLDLSGRSINDLSGIEDIPGIATVNDLLLNNNLLVELPINAFQSLTHLKKLWLDGNPLQSISSGAFSGLNGLELLSLNKTSLLLPFLQGGRVGIEVGAFSGLNGLRRLQVDKLLPVAERRIKQELKAFAPNAAIIYSN